MTVKLDEFLCPFHLTWRDCDMYFWKHDRVRFIIDVRDTHLQFRFEDFLSDLYNKKENLHAKNKIEKKPKKGKKIFEKTTRVTFK